MCLFSLKFIDFLEAVGYFGEILSHLFYITSIIFSNGTLLMISDLLWFTYHFSILMFFPYVCQSLSFFLLTLLIVNLVNYTMNSVIQTVHWFFEFRYFIFLLYNMYLTSLHRCQFSGAVNLPSFTWSVHFSSSYCNILVIWIFVVVVHCHLFHSFGSSFTWLLSSLFLSLLLLFSLYYWP